MHYATIEELLGASFSMQSVSYDRTEAINSSAKFLFQNIESRLKYAHLNEMYNLFLVTRFVTCAF
jgi:hypothetical protein